MFQFEDDKLVSGDVEIGSPVEPFPVEVPAREFCQVEREVARKGPECRDIILVAGIELLRVLGEGGQVLVDGVDRGVRSFRPPGPLDRRLDE